MQAGTFFSLPAVTLVFFRDFIITDSMAFTFAWIHIALLEHRFGLRIAYIVTSLDRWASGVIPHIRACGSRGDRDVSVSARLYHH